MADHVRRQIREAIGVTLTGLSTTGARVFQSRVYPLETASLPGLLIYSRDETSLPLTIHEPRMLQRGLRLEIVGVAEATSNLDDELDQIAKEVEIALAMPVANLVGLAKSIVLASTAINMQGTSQKPTGSITLLYDVDYFTFENAPDVAQ